MTRCLPGAALAVACVCLGLFRPAPARADGSVWAFGDSLSDNGNIARIIPGFSNGPGYDGARFSNGPVYVEYLPALLHQAFQPGNDKAVGGAFAGTGNLVGAILPGTATEIADFAAIGSRFAAADTVLLLAGANDYFGVLSAVGGSAIDVAAENARVTGDIVADAGRLAALGARTLVVLNVPDLGLTPRYLGDATATALSAGTDAALPTLLAPLATGGHNVYLVDLSTLLREAVADPARFGLTDVTHACNAEPSCLAADTVTQDQTLFWDSVHPNTAVHQVIAEVIANQLGAADAIGMQGQLALLDAQGFADRLLGMSAGGQGAASYAGGRVSVMLQAEQQSGRFDGRGGQDQFDDDILATTAGIAVHVSDHASVGLGFGYSRASAGASDQSGRADTDSLRFDGYHLGVFGHLDRNGMFADLAGSVVFLRDATGSRQGLFAGERIDGAPEGRAETAGAAIGYRIRRGPVGFGPVGRIGYAHAALDGYTEEGEPVLTQTVAAQRLDSLVGRAGLEADARLGVPLGILLPHVAIDAAREFLDGERTLHTSFTSAGLPITTTLPGYGATFGTVGAGVSLLFARGGVVDLGFGSSFARREVVQRDVLLSGHLRF